MLGTPGNHPRWFIYTFHRRMYKAGNSLKCRNAKFLGSGRDVSYPHPDGSTDTSKIHRVSGSLSTHTAEPLRTSSVAWQYTVMATRASASKVNSRL